MYNLNTITIIILQGSLARKRNVSTTKHHANGLSLSLSSNYITLYHLYRNILPLHSLLSDAER